MVPYDQHLRVFVSPLALLVFYMIRTHECLFTNVRYGICGSVEETEEGEGYECSGNGQESKTTRNWVVSFIVFAGVSLVIMKPLNILSKKVIMPAILTELAEQDGIVFDKDGRVLLQSPLHKPSEASTSTSSMSAAAKETNAVVVRKTLRTLGTGSSNAANGRVAIRNKAITRVVV